jgi:hypothetical protein
MRRGSGRRRTHAQCSERWQAHGACSDHQQGRSGSSNGVCFQGFSGTSLPTMAAPSRPLGACQHTSTAVPALLIPKKIQYHRRPSFYCSKYFQILPFRVSSDRNRYEPSGRSSARQIAVAPWTVDGSWQIGVIDLPAADVFERGNHHVCVSGFFAYRPVHCPSKLRAR